MARRSNQSGAESIKVALPTGPEALASKTGNTPDVSDETPNVQPISWLSVDEEFLSRNGRDPASVAAHAVAVIKKRCEAFNCQLENQALSVESRTGAIACTALCSGPQEAGRLFDEALRSARMWKN